VASRRASQPRHPLPHEATAAALVGAGMVTVVVFPLAALRLLDAEAGAVPLQEGSQARPPRLATAAPSGKMADGH